jgi:hypothetical protein
MRYLLLATLIACNSATASQPAPRNLVCERVAILSPKATCSPELSGVGDLSTHTARVTVEGAKAPVVCGLNAGQLSMACGTLEVQPVKPVDVLKDAPKSDDGKAPSQPAKAAKAK